MATKLQFKYGQWTKESAIDMSKVAGVVVYSGATRGIYVDGKEFVSGEGADKDIQNIISLLGAVKNEETGLYELSGLTNLPEGVKKEVTDVLNSLTAFRTNMVVEEYAQAEIVATAGATPSLDASTLTIFGIGQGHEGTDNDGKIYTTKDASDDSTKTSLIVNIAGEYRPTETGEKSRNWLATEETVSNAVGSLRAEIFGTLDPEELDKTIDSIKEIQEMLKGGDFVKWTHEVVNPITGETETKVDNVRVVPVKDEEGNIVSYNLPELDEDGKPVKDEQGNLVPSETVIVSYDEEGKEVYAEGYSDLQHTENVQELLQDIDNIEQKNLVATITLDPNKDNEFINYATESTPDEHGLTTQDVTIGVQYGTFKTGHGDVMDETSTAYVNGIATVEDVQKYIEERMTWMTFETSAEAVAEEINSTEGETYSLANNNEVSEPFTIQ